MAKITKISDHAFNGNHPEGIGEGYVAEGAILEMPKIGECCSIVNPNTLHLFTTSIITDILLQTPTDIKFRTLNSIYHLSLTEDDLGDKTFVTEFGSILKIIQS